jgi:hypothetical protein
MNKINKKSLFLIGALLVIGVFIPIVFAHAASFNGDPTDDPTLEVTNFTVNPNCNTCWTNSVSANAGEVVSFDIYYHNTGSNAAQDTRISVPLPFGNFTSQTVNGILWAQNASAVNGSVTVNLTSNQTLTFISGSVKWYPNQQITTPQTLPNGQSGSEIITSGGLSIGNIGTGWSHQGHIVFGAQVSGNQQQGNSPTAITNSATNIGQTSATLNGSFNPNGGNTNIWFEYGTSLTLGTTAGMQSIGSGNSSQDLSFTLNNLNQNTTYYFRAMASNSNGTTQGSILSFTTGNGGGGNGAPTVFTNTATDVTQTSVTLNGGVNPNGSNTTAWFEYGTSPSFGSTVNYQNVGSGNQLINIIGFLSNLNSNNVYYFRLVAQNSFGTTYGNMLNFVTTGGGGYGSMPFVSTNSASNVNNYSATLNGAVNPNGTNANAWFEYGPTQFLGYTTNFQSVGNNNNLNTISGYLSNLNPNTTYYFRAVAQNQYGTSYGTILSFNSSGTGAGNQPLIITKTATYVYQNSALLNGSVNPNGAITTAWFEYGQTMNLGTVTNSQPMSGGNVYVDFSSAVTGLQTGTTYYYRAVAQNSYGTTYGTILSLTTTGGGYVPAAPSTPRVIYQTIVTSAAKQLVTITPSLDKNEAVPDDGLNYLLTYRNDNSYAINNATVRIILPNEVKYLNSAPILASQIGNIVNFQLGKIPARSQSVLLVGTKVNKDVKEGSVLIFDANLNYTDKNNDFQSVSAYITVPVKGGTGGLFASLIDSISSLLGSPWFWFILLLILAVAITWYLTKKQTASSAQTANIMNPAGPSGGTEDF